MTEQEWLSSEDPQGMLVYLLEKPLISDRKLRLFACACCRQVWHLLTDRRSQRAVDLAERFADGTATEYQLTLARRAAGRVWQDKHHPDESIQTARMMAEECCQDSASRAADFMVQRLVLPSEEIVADLLREIVGNSPRQPIVRVDKPCPECNQSWLGSNPDGNGTATCVCGHVFAALKLSWITPLVLSLAEQCYEGDWAAVGLLADALMDAGCDNEDILGHLRGWKRCSCQGKPIFSPCVESPNTADSLRVIASCGSCPGNGIIRLPRQDHIKGCGVIDLLTGRQ